MTAPVVKTRRDAHMKLRELFDQVSSRRHHSKTLFQLVRAMGALLTVFVVGTVGYHEIAQGKATWLDAAYMTVITLTTVGYGEIVAIKGNDWAELFTIGLILFGMGTFLYFVSTLTAFVVEGELMDILWRRKLDKKIDKMDGHFIVAGLGNTGSYVFPEIVASGRGCVIIERDVERIYRLMEEVGEDVPFIEGDATDDTCLECAGVERAAGLVFSLGNDRDNLFAVISARRLNPNAAIVTRGEDPRSEKKFRMAGATSVIYTNVLGGLRMASEVLRPEVTTFLDLMMADHGRHRMVEELRVPFDSPLAGLQIRNLGLREFCDALVIAVWEKEDEQYHFNPGPDYQVLPGSKLILLTTDEDLPKIEAHIGGTKGIGYEDW